MKSDVWVIWRMDWKGHYYISWFQSGSSVPVSLNLVWQTLSRFQYCNQRIDLRPPLAIQVSKGRHPWCANGGWLRSALLSLLGHRSIPLDPSHGPGTGTWSCCVWSLSTWRLRNDSISKHHVAVVSNQCRTRESRRICTPDQRIGYGSRTWNVRRFGWWPKENNHTSNLETG